MLKSRVALFGVDSGGIPLEKAAEGLPALGLDNSSSLERWCKGGRLSEPDVGDGGFERGGSTCCCRARVITSFRYLASWNPGTAVVNGAARRMLAKLP